MASPLGELTGPSPSLPVAAETVEVIPGEEVATAIPGDAAMGAAGPSPEPAPNPLDEAMGTASNGVSEVSTLVDSAAQSTVQQVEKKMVIRS